MGVGEGQLRHPFTVVQDFPFPVLLGHDFMSKVQAVLDFRQGTVSLACSPSGKHVELTIRQMISESEVGAGGSRDLSDGSDQTCVFTSVDSQVMMLQPGEHFGHDHQQQQESPPDRHFSEQESHPEGSLSEQKFREIDWRGCGEYDYSWKPSQHVVINSLIRDLTTIQWKEVSDLVDRYNDVFSSSEADIGQRTVVEHVIDTGTCRPVNSPPYRTGPFERKEINNQVLDMVRQGIG